jgi:hypothetical protein
MFSCLLCEPVPIIPSSAFSFRVESTKTAPNTIAPILLFATAFLKLGPSYFPAEYLAKALEVLSWGTKLFSSSILLWSERLRLMGTARMMARMLNLVSFYSYF